MQLTNILAFLALTAVGAVAAPGKPAPPPKPVAPPKPAPPVINNQVNYCSSGSPFCCSPTVDNDGKGGTTCKVSTTQCNSISICCNNAQNGGAPSISIPGRRQLHQNQFCGTATTMTFSTSVAAQTLSSFTTTTTSSDFSLPSDTANDSSTTSSPRPAPLPALSSSLWSSSKFLVSFSTLVSLFV